MGIIGVCPSTSCRSQHLGCGRELLDGAVVVLGSQSLQRVPAVCVQFNDLHEERTGQLGLRRTQHLVPDGRQKLRHHFWELLFQKTSHALQLEDRRGRGEVRRVGVSTPVRERQTRSGTFYYGQTTEARTLPLLANIHKLQMP